jgi:hypothetical protein
MNTTDEQAYIVSTGRQIADKAIHSLKGILLGINMDGEINQKEIGELHKWSVDHKDLITKNPFREFIVTIGAMAKNSLPTKETIEDLYWLTQKYEGDNHYYNTLTSDLQILQGLCHGILADGTIHEKEILELNKWLDNHEHLCNHYPYDEIRSLLLSVLSDGIIDEEEKRTLKAYFNQFIKLHDSATIAEIKADIAEVEISGLCTSDPNVIFPGKTFCITGVLKRGSRADLQNDIKNLGGLITETINNKTDYLVVGDNGNSAWTFSCYGRKVEKAVTLRKEGHKIMLIHEFDFGDIVDDLK